MQLYGRKILVTGGAGFIGSHLAERLARIASRVIVYDNLSLGSVENIQPLLEQENFRFVNGDVLDLASLKGVVRECDLVFHLAANPDVPLGVRDTDVDFEQNVVVTRNLLECMRQSESCHELVFTSTSTVYGEPAVIPTPEEYAPLLPISLYGATKLACEGLISAYCNLFGLSSLILRLANVVGARQRRGVIPDFIAKLRKNPAELEILGDGSQSKSYISVEDCVDALILAAERGDSKIRVFNVGATDSIDVISIAGIVAEEMGLKGVRHKITQVEDGRGWPGDVKKMLLDTNKIRALGWNPSSRSSKDAVAAAVRQLLHRV